MKLVITTDCFLPRWDGIARFLSLLIPELAQSMEITVFAPKFPGEVPVIKGVRVVRFPLVNMQFGDIYFSKPDKGAMTRVIKDADLVFNQTLGPIGSAGIKIANKLNKKVVSYIHNVEWELTRSAVKRGKFLAWFFVKLWARRMYNKCSLLMVPSNSISDLLAANKIVTKKEVVRLGVDVKKFSPPKSKVAAKKAVGISPYNRVVGFCGRIAREKDLPTLHEAFNIVHKKFRNTVLLIVGAGLEKEIPASRNIIRVGAQDDVVPFLRAMDIFVLPSLTETSSLATMEAMAVGLSVVATPVGSIRTYISDTENGLLFSRKDVNELVGELTLLLKHPGMRQKLGKAARRTIMKDYSWDDSVEKIKGLLKL